MRYEIIKNPLVGEDLFDIVDFIASYAGLQIAKAKVDVITGFISKLTDYRKLGSVRDDTVPGLRAIPTADKAVVCFTVDDETRTVFTLCVSYAGSDWSSRVKKRI